MKTMTTKRKQRLIISVISFIILLAGCSYPHLYYSPNMMTVPLFNKPVEFTGTVAGSFGTVNPSFELQTAFSLPAHMALGINFMTGGNNHSGDYYSDFSRYNFFEGFAGFYSSFNKSGIFEIYAGYGEGGEEHTFAYNEWDWGGGGWVQDGTAEMKFSRFFIQPDIGIRTKAIEGAFSLRLCNIDFKEISYYDTNYRLDELQLLESNKASWLLEPGFTFRGGHDPVKFQVQAIFSADVSQPDISFEHFRFNIGINIKFGKKKENIQKSPVAG